MTAQLNLSMSGYERAPATRMLSTHCAVCGRPLVDANSVEAGMGPDCRAKYGYDQEASDEQCTLMNKHVHLLALWRSKQKSGGEGPTTKQAMESMKAVRAAGFDRLAEILERRLCDVIIEETIGDQFSGPLALIVFSNYSELIHRQAYRHKMRWDSTRKGYVFVRAQRAVVFKLLCDAFPDGIGVGPKGVFLLTHG